MYLFIYFRFCLFYLPINVPYVYSLLSSCVHPMWLNRRYILVTNLLYSLRFLLLLAMEFLFTYFFSFYVFCVCLFFPYEMNKYIFAMDAGISFNLLSYALRFYLLFIYLLVYLFVCLAICNSYLYTLDVTLTGCSGSVWFFTFLPSSDRHHTPFSLITGWVTCRQHLEVWTSCQIYFCHLFINLSLAEWDPYKLSSFQTAIIRSSFCL